MTAILLILALAAEIWLLHFVNPGGNAGKSALKVQYGLCFLVFFTFCAIIHFLG